jgi:hypothetical protein
MVSICYDIVKISYILSWLVMVGYIKMLQILISENIFLCLNLIIFEKNGYTIYLTSWLIVLHRVV